MPRLLWRVGSKLFDLVLSLCHAGVLVFRLSSFVPFWNLLLNPSLHRSSCLTNSRTAIPCIVPSVSTMRVRTLEIRWHDNKPISTCDFQPLSFKKARPANERDFVTQSYRLATGGEDNNVRVCISFFEDFVSFVRRGVLC